MKKWLLDNPLFYGFLTGFLLLLPLVVYVHMKANRGLSYWEILTDLSR